MNDKLIGTTSTGISLYTNEATEAAQKYAKSLKLRNINIFIAEREHKSRLYIIVKNGEVIYETTYYEQIGTRLCIIKALRKR